MHGHRLLGLVLGIGLLAALGCSSGGDNDDDDDDDDETEGDTDTDTDADTDTDTDTDATPPTVFGVNDGTVPQGEPVTLEGVVVTSPITRDGDGFFVADPAGGAYSGLYVWCQTGLDLAISEGDEVTVTGVPTDYYGWMELVVDGSDAVEITGEADAPAPVDLGDGAGVDWEAYESVVVTLDDQTIESVDEFNTSLLSAGVALDDGFTYLDHECRGSYEALTGVVFYAYEAHSLNPRGDADLEGYSGPEAAEATIAELQAGEMCGPVTVVDAVVTAGTIEDDGDTTFFLQDEGGGSGIGVFVAGATVDVSVGDTVTVSGAATEYYDFTQLYVSDAGTLDLTGTGRPVAESLSSPPSDWEPYEGMLLTLSDVEVTSDATYGAVETNWSVLIDSLYYDFSAGNGDAFSSVTGVLNYEYSEWKITPRDARDLVE